MRNFALIAALVASSVASTLASNAAWSENIVIKQVAVYNGIDDTFTADVHVENGILKGIGSNLVSNGADVIDGRGKSVTAGLFNGYTYMGLVEVSAIKETVDYESESDVFTTSHRAADAVNPDSVAIPYNRALGLSRALVIPVNEKSIFAGQAAIVQMRHDKPLLIESAAQVVHLGQHGKDIVGGSRSNALNMFKLALSETKDYAANTSAIRRGEYRDLHFELHDLEALRPIVTGKQAVIISVDRAVDIERVLDLVGEYSLKAILLGARDAWRVADRLAAMNVAVIIDPIDNLPMGYDSLGSRLDAAALLAKAGVKMVFTGMGSGGSPHNAALVRQSAANAVTHGLSVKDAIAALTVTPSTVFGLQKGLTIGKAVDMVLWSGHPLEVMSLPEKVYVDGVEQSLENRPARLAKRYLSVIKSSMND